MAGPEELLGWVDRVRRHQDDRALDRLLSALRPEIVAYLRRRLRSRPSTKSVAEELTQETLVRIAESIDRCRARSEPEFRAWVHTIARRLAIDWYRRRQEELDRRLWTAAPETTLHGQVEEAPAADEVVDVVGLVLGQLLAEAYGSLSPETQEAVWRRLQLGETWAEVGRAIGSTAGGAKRRWQRAVARMRKEVTLRVRTVESHELRRALLRRLGRREV